MRHIAGLSGREIVIEYGVHVGHQTNINQVPGEMRAADKARVTDEALSARKRIADTASRQFVTDPTSTLVPATAVTRQPVQQMWVVRINVEANDMDGFVFKGDGDFDAGQQLQPTTRRRSSLVETKQLVMIGQSEQCNPVATCSGDDLSRTEPAIGSGGMAVKINIHPKTICARRADPGSR